MLLCISRTRCLLSACRGFTEFVEPLLSVLAVVLACSWVIAEPPLAVLPDCRLTQIAQHPEVVTPIGLAFRNNGELLVVESHTHKRQDDYPGPPGDRIRRMIDSNGDHIPDQWAADLASGYRHALHVLPRSDAKVYVVTRNNVHLLTDNDGDGVAEDDQVIVRLDTEADYPHNALSGICLDGDELYLGMGENFGAKYKITGSDGSSHSDAGGAGRIYVCQPDGSCIKPMATGLWNPFGLCKVGGRLFCIDNDPDSAPPCRLLDVQHGNDFGFRYEYGRAGVHPLHAWDGQLPATKGMVCGVGEAPTAIISYRGWLWVTSWGEHRIERYRLSLVNGQPVAEREVVVQGLTDFRPTGLAIGPDGALYFGDWVRRNYPVHGHGRIWRLELPPNEITTPLPEFQGDDLSERVVSQAGQGVVAAVIKGNLQGWESLSSANRLGALEVARWEDSLSPKLLRLALKDVDSDVRLCAVRYAAEGRFSALVDDIQSLIDDAPDDPQYYLAAVGAMDWLKNGNDPRAASFSNNVMARELDKKELPNSLQAIALAMVSPDHPMLEGGGIDRFLQSDYLPLRLQAIQTLNLQSSSSRFERLLEIALDLEEDAKLRATAVCGLAAAAQEHKSELLRLSQGSVACVAKEAARVLRLTGLAPALEETKPPPQDLAAWNKLLSEGGDVESGRRLFFMSAGLRCARCHRHSGSGADVGPDLTKIGKQLERSRVVASIIQPSQEVAPRYEPWVLELEDGSVRSGLRMPQGGDNGRETYVDINGHSFTLTAVDISSRHVIDKSIMPDGIEQLYTIEDLRDLVAFLMN